MSLEAIEVEWVDGDGDAGCTRYCSEDYPNLNHSVAGGMLQINLGETSLCIPMERVVSVILRWSQSGG